MNRMNAGMALVVTFILCFTIKTVSAQEQEDTMQLPKDRIIKETDKYVLEEHRIGGRLERVTVKRHVGVTEIYQNQRNDTIWVAGESELGDVENVRQWKIGSW